MPEYQPRESINKIDPDKVAENPGLLPYAHHVGSAIIAPIDQGRARGLAMSAMYEQTGTQLTQIREQVELLIAQAQKVHDRIAVSESIYTAEAGFKPIISQVCYLYQRDNGVRVLSLVGPSEWRKGAPYEYIATVKKLADHTWDVLELKGEFETNQTETVEAEGEPA